MKRILVATDGSEQARRAVDVAAGLAAAVRCGLTLVHVVPTWQTPLEATVMPGYGSAVQAEWMRRGEQFLREERLRLGSALSVETLVVAGHPGETIAHAAETCGADMIVVGSRGLGSVSRVILGSTSTKLVHLATRPTMVVP